MFFPCAWEAMGYGVMVLVDFWDCHEGGAKMVAPMECWIMGFGIFGPTSSCLAWREDAPKHLYL
ncbi:MAG: hypothetical protein CL731_02125 [Chloroflexi bacterium]|nr:hypothetical protein [Chloroflexota bacterium]